MTVAPLKLVFDVTADRMAEAGRSAPVDLHPDIGLVQRERDLFFGDFDFFMTSGPPWARVSPEIL
jgi:hypothetical protein